MLERNGLRRRRLPLFCLLALLSAISAAPASAQAPGLPRTFDVRAIDTPNPLSGGSFGWGVTSADLTGDGRPDLLVAQAQTGPGQVFIYDGATGQLIDTINPPEKNPGNTNDEVIAFVYVETMPDVGQCPGGDGPDADRICDLAALPATGDGIPEILVGARNLKVNSVNGATPPVAGDQNIGRTYIIDGATRAVLKRIDMPQADRALQDGLNANSQFGRQTISAQAMPPCAGLRSENNNLGVGPCPDVPQASRIGDLNLDGTPDIVVTARNFVETPAQSAATSQCRNQTANCTSGKAWAYSGAVAGTNPQTINETPLYAMQNPRAQSGGQEFGGNVYRVGDVTGNAAPEFVITARNLTYPLAGIGTPPVLDLEFASVGAAFMFNGNTGANTNTAAGNAITSPEPQKNAQFSGSFNGGRAVGDVGATTLPDILLPAALQNDRFADDGVVWAFNAVGGGGGATGSWNFARLTDPTPSPGGNFGGSFSGVGNLADGPDNPANEVLFGGYRFDPFTETTAQVSGDLHIMNVSSGRNLMTIPHPEGGRDDGFGVGLTPMGDLNGDGYLDLAATAYLYNASVASQGRAWIFTSNNAPLPAPPSSAPTTATGPAAISAAVPAAERPPLLAGRCTNQSLGTDGPDRMGGTLAGDQIFAFEGDDVISGFQGADCLDGAGGNDLLDGDDDRDKLVGGTGHDTLAGGDDRDELFGEAGNDALLGEFGRDMLAGGAGNDRLVGGNDSDRLFGEDGKDRIIGGPGANVMDGGAGNDSIEARNGRVVDKVYCGRGRDRVRVDGVDRVGTDCEVVYIGRSRRPASRAAKARLARGARG